MSIIKAVVQLSNCLLSNFESRDGKIRVFFRCRIATEPGAISLRSIARTVPCPGTAPAKVAYAATVFKISTKAVWNFIALVVVERPGEAD